MELIKHLCCPDTCIINDLATINQIRVEYSERYSSLRQKQDEIKEQLATVLPDFVFLEFDNALEDYSADQKKYWWSRGLESAISLDSLQEIKKIRFRKASTQETDASRIRMEQQIKLICTNCEEPVFELALKYMSKYLGDCKLAMPYAFLLGFEWGNRVLKIAGIDTYIIPHETLCRALPLE